MVLPIKSTVYFGQGFAVLDMSILSDIQNVLNRHNRYVTAFKTAAEILTDVSEMQLVFSLPVEGDMYT